MIQINLLPVELRKKQRTHAAPISSAPLLKGAAAVAGIILVLQLIVGAAALVRKAEIFNLQRQFKSWQEKNADTIAKKTKTNALRARITRIQSMTARNFFWSSLLSALTGSMTKGVWLRELVHDASPRLLLKGSAIGQGQETAHIGKFVKELKANNDFAGLFDQIELSNIQQRKVKEFDVYDFEVLCVFKKEQVVA